MDKLHTRFQTKTAQKPYPMGGGAHTCIVYIREYPPGSYVSGKLPTYPSPRPTLTLTSPLEQNALGLAIITEQQNPIAKKIWFSIHARNFGSHVTLRPTVRLSVCPSVRTTWKPMWDVLVSVGACKLILHVHVVINWQLSKQDIHWSVSHDRIAGSGIYSSRLLF